ncbi:hypothetical protein NPIL_612511 [Nephila pilipes]|uniref:Uncharacterized protein n=1 Tax=Nephila pilipes TaxID=299642 RepID=A0A8X6P1H1_NEPPI|nr:hypothetical protein NPIL_612511 [Nephila pilipes]
MLRMYWVIGREVVAFYCSGIELATCLDAKRRHDGAPTTIILTVLQYICIRMVPRRMLERLVLNLLLNGWRAAVILVRLGGWLLWGLWHGSLMLGGGPHSEIHKSIDHPVGIVTNSLM